MARRLAPRAVPAVPAGPAGPADRAALEDPLLVAKSLQVGKTMAKFEWTNADLMVINGGLMVIFSDF